MEIVIHKEVLMNREAILFRRAIVPAAIDCSVEEKLRAEHFSTQFYKYTEKTR